MALSIPVSGEMAKETAMECSNGLIIPSMKVIGHKIKLMGMGHYFMLMGMYMKATGLMIRPMGKVSILMLMVRIIMVSGKMTSNMVLALKNGLMGQFMRVNTVMERRTV